MNAFVVHIWNTCMKSRFLWVKGVGHKKAGGNDVNSTLYFFHSRHCKSINGAQRPPMCCSIFLLIFKENRNTWEERKIEIIHGFLRGSYYKVLFVFVKLRWFLRFCFSLVKETELECFPPRDGTSYFWHWKEGKLENDDCLKKYTYNIGTREMRVSACSQQCSIKTQIFLQSFKNLGPVVYIQTRHGEPYM